MSSGIGDPKRRIVDWFSGKPPAVASAAGCAIFLLVAIAWSSAPFLAPHTLSGESFLFSDQSYALFTADQLVSGKLLFRDVFYPYGPASAYLHAAWTTLFGNTALSFWHLAQVLTCINVLQLWCLLRRGCSIRHTLVFGIVVLFPFLLIPGGMVGGLNASVYVPLERTLLLALALAWRSPEDRTFRSAALLGALLGAMQWVKFGGAFVAGAALLIADLVLLGSALKDRALRDRWFKINLATLLGFLGVEGARIGLAFALFAAPLALDVVWPAWLVEAYRSYAYRTVPFVHWFNFNYFIGAQLPVVAALVANLFLVRRLASTRRSRAETVPGSALVYAILFPLALVGYLPHSWVAAPYVWLFLVPAVFALERVSTLWRSLFLAACLSATALTLKGAVAPPPPASLQKWRAAGDVLWLRPEMVVRLSKLKDVLAGISAEAGAEAQTGSAILGFTFGSGLHHFLQYPGATRHAWFVPGFVPPRDEAEFLQALDRTFAVVVYFPEPRSSAPPPDPRAWEPFAIPVLTDATCLTFADRLLPPREIDRQLWVFPVRPMPTLAKNP
jgi:hypothetical protein